VLVIVGEVLGMVEMLGLVVYWVFVLLGMVGFVMVL